MVMDFVNGAPGQVNAPSARWIIILGVRLAFSGARWVKFRATVAEFNTERIRNLGDCDVKGFCCVTLQGVGDNVAS